MNHDELSAKSPNFLASMAKADASLAAQNKKEKAKKARKAPFERVAEWMVFLPITPIQREVMGLIYAFQCAGGSYHLSLTRGAKKLNMSNRAVLQKNLKSLVNQGFLIKIANGQCKPAIYLVDEAVCWDIAIKNGYEPPEEEEETDNDK